MGPSSSRRRFTGDARGLLLYLLCSGLLLIVLSTTIVPIALPSIVSELNIPVSSMTWTLNAYTLGFGGFLLLSGRLGDLYGYRRLFLLGIASFSLASAICGLAHSSLALNIARFAQGLCAALVNAAAFSLVVRLFPDQKERTRAMAIYGCVYGIGGGIGELLGGVLTQTLGWHWIFLINLPIGAAVYLLSTKFLPRDNVPAFHSGHLHPHHLDVAGAISITSALTLFVYTLLNGNELGWHSAQIHGVLIASGLLLVLFIYIEWRAPDPLMPLRLFRHRTLVAMSTTAILWASGTLAWFVIGALYLQRVLGYSPLRVGLSFLPSEIASAAFSVGLSNMLVSRLGVRPPLVCGLLLVTAGLALLSRAPLQATFATDVLPSMLALGCGTGMACAPLLLAVTRDLQHHDSGIVSGIINTSFILGGALGLAIVVTLATLRTTELQHSGAQLTDALNRGYHLAFLIGALLTFTAALLSHISLQAQSRTLTSQHQQS